MNWKSLTGKKYGLVFVTLLLVLLAIYGNSFNALWHFDDFDNIVNNRQVHLKNLSWTELKNTLYFLGHISRPAARLSFGLNYYFGRLDVFGYHVVNVTLHLLSSFLLFLVIHRTLNLPLLREEYGRSSFTISFLATLLWSVNPVQVTAVTYLIQRMSSMAGLFFLLAMFAYIRGRTSQDRQHSILFYGLCGASFLLSFGSKENALMLPVILFLYDLFLIQGLSTENIKKNLKIIAIPMLAAVLLGLWWIDFKPVIEGYQTRYFTLVERLLTQPRVIFLYLTLLFYPVPTRLAFFYDVHVSRSLFEPWTTAAAILGMALIIGGALLKARRWPLISFCVLFFFLNHVIEGSILPLELAYEHRNYIPSMFLFVPVAILMVHVYDHCTDKQIIRRLLIVAVAVMLALQGLTTYKRNDVLADEKTLWMDNVEKTPRSSRVRALLGKVLLMEGNYERALEEFQAALKSDRWINRAEPAIYHCYVGNIYLDMSGDEEKARTCYTKSLEYATTHEYYNGMAMLFLKKGDFDAAEATIVKAIALKPGNTDYHSNHALILLKEGDLDGAMASSRKALDLAEDHSSPLTIIAEALRRKGLYAESASYWGYYLQKRADRNYAYLALMDLHDAAGKDREFAEARDLLLQGIGSQAVLDFVQGIQQRKNFYSYVPVPERIVFLLKKKQPDRGAARRDKAL
ncbi:MAG TPA: tetratricopeptide repeat protein [Syntrophales bacterium]|nr:tetratricopeptide repeat protein [Syntrophales bacterium]HOX94581.1 tetratricopeptide repeat protein [Syntrophales bacterium]HPI56391.1 tetratricopeptide repeat protein [Syntrophales bacterium]HPN24222.1 tetratricopeptide repeat protein [Syntrophales bacterium]HQM28575.1 tetratricopeptide repeat protein [Syntrophales bacterium]